MLSAVRRHGKSIATTTAVAVLAAIPISFAILHKGFPVTDVDLDAKDVWVTNAEELLAGRLNRQIEELNGAVGGQSPALDVLQNTEHVFLVDPQLGQLSRIDPAYTSLVEPATIPAAATVSLGGSTLSIVSPEGQLWVVDVSNELAFDPGTEPVAELGEGGRATVSTEGVVFATSVADATLTRIDFPGAEPEVRDFEVPEQHQLAAVGDVPVVLDVEGERLLREDGSSTALPEAGIKLQQSGEESDSAIVATGDDLLLVPLGGGEVERVAADIEQPVTDPDAVSSPVRVDGCAHGAWSGAQRYLLACGGDDAPAPQDIEQPTQGSVLEFRVKGKVVVLNDLTTGNVWLVDEQMRLVDNWDEVTPPEEEETEEGDEKSATESFEDTLAKRTEVNTTPTARDDQYGVRPGRTTILPVLDNDTDPDGDVLTIPSFDGILESQGKIDVIDGGRALQFTPAPGASSASFRYTVDDGRPAGVASALVTIRVVPESENNPPVSKRTTSISVESGGSASYNVLADWVDPDGDDVFLASAAPKSADVVRFTPDGFVTFEHKSGEIGAKEVQFVVSDGHLPATGTLEVQVEGSGALTPIGTPDFAEAFPGEQVTIAPLANDTSPSGQPLALAGTDEVPSNVTVGENLERGTLTFTAPAPGSYYFKYGLTAGAASSVGLIRVEVVEEPEDQLPPIAVKDTAYLRAGEPTIVEVLNNDVSANNNVLAVQATDLSATDPAVSVEVLNNTVIRITSSAALTEQTQLQYTISDGIQVATAGVTIVPVPPIVNRQPPVALDDRVRVRAGDVVSADVTANDFHPDQATITVDPELVDVAEAGDGLPFVNGDAVRYQAPQEPGEYSVVYRIADQYGESATARVFFTVVGPDLDNNRPPAPAPQVARVFAGSTIPIDVPLDGIDPDGDSVVIIRQSAPPTLGELSATGPRGFEYTAGPDSAGTDVFEYEVQDSFGERAIGQITVGVIPRPETSEPPNAVDDAIELKPGRTASVAVLLNDSDPSGYVLSLEDELVEVPEGISVEVERSKIIVEAPEEEGSFTIGYQISNGQGGVDTAFVQVRVTEDAKPMHPTAQDFYVDPKNVEGEEVIEVPLDGIIGNPGGRDEDLVVTVEGPNSDLASVDQENQTVSVRPGESRIAVAYRVTNELDDLSATAFIVIPPEVSANYSPPPFIPPDKQNQTIPMNRAQEWDLSEFVEVPSGKAALIADAGNIGLTNPAAGTAVAVDQDTLAFTPAQDYRGPAAIRFEVTDGDTPDDINGNRDFLVFKIIVGDPNFEDTPPQFVQQSIEIEAGEEPRQVDLRDSTSHPNPTLIDQFSYTGLSGTTAAIEALLSGSTLSVSSPLGTQPGARTTLTFTVQFDDFTVPGTVTVTTVASKRPLAQAVADAAKGQRGRDDTVNVLGNDFNPFPEEPLRVVDAQVENAAESQAEVSFTEDGDITIAPGASFIGVVSVVYTIADATDDPSREVQGRLQYTVRDVPDKPNAPAVEPRDTAAQVTWDIPATNGEPIDSYRITWNGGSAEVPGMTTTYTATGLTNGADYTFTVSAHNVLGWSEISNQSAAVRPFGKPLPPTNVTAQRTDDGSGDVLFAWSGAEGNGRPIQGYTISVDGQTIDAGPATSFRFDGNVGAPYSATVTSRSEGGQSAASGASPQRTSIPSAPGNPRADGPPRGQRQVTLNWNASRADGANVTEYVLDITNRPVQRVGGNQTSYSFQGEFGVNYSFTVRAITGNGAESLVSAPSNVVTPQDNPPTPAPQPSYRLCYFNTNYIGVIVSNQNGQSHRYDIVGHNSAVSSSIDNGVVRTQSWHNRAPGDLSAMKELRVDNQLVLTQRWGDAQQCP